MTTVKPGARIADVLQKILIGAYIPILALLPFHAFLSTWGGTAFGPLLVWKSWKEILLLLLLPFLLWLFVLRPDVARTVWQSWLIKLVAVYVVLNFIFATVSQASTDAALAGLLMNVRFFAIFLLAYTLCVANHSWVERLKKWLPTGLFAATVVVSVIAIAQVTVLPKDFLTFFGYSDATIPAYLVVDDNPDALRAYATLRGPNPFGSFLLLPIALALVAVVRQRRNVLAGLALGLGIFALVLTSSRSAWLGALAAAAVLAVTLVPHAKLIKAVKWGAIPALLAGVLFFWLAATVPALRLAVFHSSPGDPHLLEGSTQKHWEEIAAGAGDAVAHPLGQGVGAAGPASFYNANEPPKLAENYFIQLAQEVGIAGALLFIAINVIVILKLWRRRFELWPKALLASFIGITVISLFQHGWADDPTAMVWWGLAGLYLYKKDKAP